MQVTPVSRNFTMPTNSNQTTFRGVPVIKNASKWPQELKDAFMESDNIKKLTQTGYDVIARLRKDKIKIDILPEGEHGIVSFIKKLFRRTKGLNTRFVDNVAKSEQNKFDTPLVTLGLEKARLANEGIALNYKLSCEEVILHNISPNNLRARVIDFNMQDFNASPLHKKDWLYYADYIFGRRCIQKKPGDNYDKLAEKFLKELPKIVNELKSGESHELYRRIIYPYN